MTTPTMRPTPLGDALARQAQDAGHPDVHLPTVLAEGTRRRRGRRTLTAAAAGVLAASVVAGATLVPQMLGSEAADSTQAASVPSTGTAPFVYATTTAVHLDGTAVDLPGQPEQLVQVSSGAVLLSEGKVWWVRAADDPVQLGSYAPSTIPGGVRAYGDGDQVGWVTVNEHSTVIQVADLGDTDRAVVRSEIEATAPLPALPGQTRLPLVLDGDTAYVQDHSGIRSFSLSSPNAAPEVLAPAGTGLHLLDAESGQILWNTEDARTQVGTTWGAGTVRGPDLALAQLSPGGRYVVGDGRGLHVVIELATGREIPVDVDAHNDVTRAVAWTDERTFVVQTYPNSPVPWQGQDQGTPEFRSCVVPNEGSTLTCTLLPGVPDQETFMVAATNMF